jgi:hypothetical protein
VRVADQVDPVDRVEGRAHEGGRVTSVQLTKNFTRPEFDVSGRVPASLEANVKLAAALFQWFRDLVGGPLQITSFYRSPEHNADVHGVAHSEHMDARAGDLIPITTSKLELARRLFAAEAAGTAPLYGQFIIYADTNHFHLSLPRSDGRANRQKLLATGAKKANGDRVYVALTDPQKQLSSVRLRTPYAAWMGAHAAAAAAVFFFPALASLAGAVATLRA